MCRVFLLLLALCGLGACAVRPPPIMQPPSGKGWIAHNQAYNVQQASSSSQSYGSVTVTTTTATSRNLVLFGSPLRSAEEPRCKGRAWLQDCDFSPKE
jgi:hypothetical protein